MTPCADCLSPATTTVYAGTFKRGTTWHRYWTPMCEPCAIRDRVEREEARSSCAAASAAPRTRRCATGVRP